MDPALIKTYQKNDGTGYKCIFFTALTEILFPNQEMLLAQASQLTIG